MESEDAHIESWNRFFAEAVRTWATSRNVACEFSFGDWLIRLERNGIVKHIEWCDIGLNTSAQYLVAKDKSATSHILNREKVPTVEHMLVLRPHSKGWSPNQNELIENFFTEHHNDIVVKPNTGAGGNDVVRVTSLAGGATLLTQLFEKYRAVSLSPFYACTAEYRVTVLDAEVVHMYEKHLAPESGEFRFNLAHGATAHEVTPAVFGEVSVIARTTAVAMGGRFLNIDVMRLADGTLRVMEVNGSVAFEKYVVTSATAQEKAMQVYARALDRLFEIA